MRRFDGLFGRRKLWWMRVGRCGPHFRGGLWAFVATAIGYKVGEWVAREICESAAKIFQPLSRGWDLQTLSGQINPQYWAKGFPLVLGLDIVCFGGWEMIKAAGGLPPVAPPARGMFSGAGYRLPPSR